MEVLCLEDSIHVALEESGQIQLNKDNLRLSDPNCTLHSNGTHLLANMSLIGCGTQMEVSDKYILTYSLTFKNLNTYKLTACSHFYTLSSSHTHWLLHNHTCLFLCSLCLLQGCWHIPHLHEYDFVLRWPKWHYNEGTWRGHRVLMQVFQAGGRGPKLDRSQTHSDLHRGVLRHIHPPVWVLRVSSIYTTEGPKLLPPGVWCWRYDVHADWVYHFCSQHWTICWILSGYSQW